MCERPLFDDLELADIVGFHRALVTCGANIREINAVRKHFSAVKGGRLAATAGAVEQVSLAISDVPLQQPSFLASGPSLPDESTVAETLEIIHRYRLAPRLPLGYARRLNGSDLPETPKPGDPCFEHSRLLTLLSNQDAIKIMAETAARPGWTVEQDSSCDEWSVNAAADYLTASLRPLPRPACLISGGELSSPVTGDGLGGRNQAFALACAQRIAGERIAVMSAGTDGIDGNSPAAGAIASGATLARAAELGMEAQDFQARCDSYEYFRALGDIIMTGPTGTNVRDLRVLVAW